MNPFILAGCVFAVIGLIQLAKEKEPEAPAVTPKKKKKKPQQKQEAAASDSTETAAVKSDGQSDSPEE